MVISDQIKSLLRPGLTYQFSRLYSRSALAAIKEKRMRMYYGRAGGYWALREGMKRW